MPNQPKTKARTVRIDDETWTATLKRAKKDGITASDVVRKALRALLAGLVALGLMGCTDHASAGAAERPKATWTAHSHRTPPRDLIQTFTYGSLIAHRGAGKVEESMAGYAAAAAGGYALEMDVQTLADGTLVLMHDGTVDRTTDGTGRVSGKTLAQWERLHLADGTTPPTWGLVAGTFGGRSLLVVETKDRRSVRPLINSIRKRGIQRDVLVQSFTLSDVRAAAAAGIPAMLLGAPPASFRSLSAYGIHYWGPSTNTRGVVRLIGTAKRAGVKTVPWVVDDATTADKTWGGGAYAVFTDRPHAIPAP
jgi:glycerophosphoryl diester phosphodiesterase